MPVWLVVSAGGWLACRVRKFSDWCRSHPWIASVAGFAGFCLLLHFFLNWQAERRWEKYCEGARARGVKLTLPEFAPPEIPEEENFAALPLLRFAGGTAGAFALPPSNRPLWGGDPMNRQSTNWTAWQTYFQANGFIAAPSADPVRDSLQGLDHFAPQIQEWQQWKTRPRSRFPAPVRVGDDIVVATHLATPQQAAQVFSLKARAHLALGESAQAYRAFRDGLQAYLAVRDEPSLIAGLVRTSSLSLVMAAVGDGLMHQAWAEPELRQLEEDLASISLAKDFHDAMSSERGYVNTANNDLIDSAIVQRSQMTSRNLAASATFATAAFGASPPALSPAICMLIPRRMYRDNQLRQNQQIDELLAQMSPVRMHFDPDRDIPSAPGRGNALEELYYFLSHPSFSVFEWIEKRYLRQEIGLDHTRLAIALERFRLREGNFPAALSALVPDFSSVLPRDPYSGKEYRYESSRPKSYLLYSAGENRRDDGGTADVRRAEQNQLDIIWFYTPSPR